ncbi:terpene synthase family protein [Yinghuangia sp. YIM S09857]|uniref:terpene synthase family protein n=1 Tax=Yinghuangia sp. YIM S09857 TaxID=3436929 RepID=UPI003F53004E
MPQSVHFTIPFASRVSPDLDRARPRNLDWTWEHGLVRGEAGLREYASWDLAQAAARTYPHATGDDLDMLINWFGFAFLFDDQFDASGDRPSQVSAVAREMIAIPFRPVGTPPDVVCPVTLAWVEIWPQMCAGMSETWQNRFASNWARFMAAAVCEIHLAAHGEVMDLDGYLALRQHTVGLQHSLDAVERIGGFEVPPQAQAHPVMRRLRHATTDCIAYMNDIHSLDREEARGDRHNLVTVLKRHLGCSRSAALDEAIRMTYALLDEVIELHARIPDMCDELQLTDEERKSVELGVAGTGDWIRGNYEWGLASGRYTVAPTTQMTGPAPYLESLEVLPKAG